MAKPMLVTLPFVLLLLDFWPLQRFQIHSTIQRLRRRKNSVLPARRHFLRRDFSGATRRRRRRVARTGSAAVCGWKMRSVAYGRYLAENFLAGQPGRHLSAAGNICTGMHASRRSPRRLLIFISWRCLAGAQTQPLFARRLALVSRHARAGHRPRASRRRRAGRPLYLFSGHRNFHRRRFRRVRSGQTVSISENILAVAAILILARA